MSPRRGMTLIEVMIALVILSGALLSLGRYTGQFARTSSNAGLRITALQLATARVDSVKGAPTYAAVDGFAGTESRLTGFTGYARATIVQRIGGGPSDLVDYKVVTVSVTHPALATPVKKTTMVGAF